MEQREVTNLGSNDGHMRDNNGNHVNPNITKKC